MAQLKSTKEDNKEKTMNRVPDSELVLVPGGTLITATPEAGRALAMTMARQSSPSNSRPSPQRITTGAPDQHAESGVGKGLHPKHRRIRAFTSSRRYHDRVSRGAPVESAVTMACASAAPSSSARFTPLPPNGDTT